VLELELEMEFGWCHVQAVVGAVIGDSWG